MVKHENTPTSVNCMRGLSNKFIHDLQNQDGILYPILERIRNDHTLMLAIRDGYLNVYYRGGNILKVSEDKGFYQTFFDVNYGLGKIIDNAESTVESRNDAEKMVDYLSNRKMIMDEFFAKKGKAEREFQQLVARENNNSSISGKCEYFITDIEITIRDLARFDMAAIQWLAKDRKNGSRCKPALIEMKYGDSSLQGDAGLVKHLKDMDTFISKRHEQYVDLLHTMENQFNQLVELRLLKYNQGVSNAKIKLEVNVIPEIVFIIANHNPRSKILRELLAKPEVQMYGQSKLFDLKFYVASFAGYGLHTNCMHELREFQSLVGLEKTE
jgi:hypothetical protein